MRTFTRYWTPEDLEPVWAALGDLQHEWDSRRQHVSFEDQIIGDGLLNGVRSAVAAMLTRAD